MKRICTVTALFLLLTLFLNSCGDTAAPSAPNADATAAAASNVQTDAGATATSGPVSGVPEGLDFDGAVVTLFNNPYHATETVYFNATEQNGEIINDTVYARNIEVMEKLNVNLSYIDDPTNNSTKKVSAAVTAGDDAYTIVISSQTAALDLSLKSCLLNILDAPYIDLDADWWATDYIDAINIGKQKRYFVSGDITTTILRYITCTFVNRSAYEASYGDPDALYDTVLNGGWTLDLVEKMSAETYRDLNGSGAVDEEDFFCYLYNNASTLDSLYLNSGATYSHRDAENLPVIDPLDDVSVRAWEKLVDLTFKNSVSMKSDKDRIIQLFGEEKALLLFGWFYACDSLRTMESDYSLLPAPKLDESVASYKANVHNTTGVICLPVTTADMELAAAVIEELAYIGWRDLSPAYYEIALKGKYMRDGTDKAMQIIDMIHDSMTTDTVYAFAQQLANLGRAHRKIVDDKLENLTAYYESIRSQVDAGLDDLITAYNN